MKSQFNHYFKLLIVLFFNFLLTNGCQKEDEENITTQLPRYQVERIAGDDLQSNYLILEKLSEFSPKEKEQSGQFSRVLYNNNYGFSVITDDVKHIVDTDTGLDSYNFPITRDSIMSDKIENLVLQENQQGSYEAYIVEYGFNEEEYILSSEDFLISTNTKYTPIDFDESIFYQNEMARTVTEYLCAEVWVFEYGYSPDHGYMHGAGCNNTCGEWVLSSSGCNWVTYDDGATVVNSGGAGLPPSNSSGGGNTNNSNTNLGDTIINSSPVVQSSSRNFINFINSLSEYLRIFLNAPENYAIRNKLLEDLEDDNFSIIAKNKAELDAILAYTNDSNDPRWDYTRNGAYLNNSALSYIAAYDVPYPGEGTMYLLSNERQVLFVTQTQRIINPNNGVSVGTSEIPLDDNYFYLKDYDSDEWYEFGLPYNTPDCLSCDLNAFFESVLVNGLVITGRYFFPFEDILILITGEDFEGVESSRAVAGTFLLLDLIPGTELIKAIKVVRYGDEAVQFAEAVIKYVDDIYKSQKQTIKNVLVGVFDLDEFGNTIRKGNFGEMVTDTDLFEKGYDSFHIRRTDIDEPLSQGIDGVFQNPQTGEFIIVESKYNTSGLSMTNDGLQMSDNWIQGGNRLVNEVGPDLANEIMDSGYVRVLAKVLPDGTITYYELDFIGQIIGPWTP